MKKFKFKLEVVKKLRESRVDKIKFELASILNEIHNNEQKIKVFEDDIIKAYKEQEKNLKDYSFKFFPNFVKGLKEKIKSCENNIKTYKAHYSEKIKELAHARGEVKVMDSIKDKDFHNFKKEMNKKEQETIEDLLNIRRVSS